MNNANPNLSNSYLKFVESIKSSNTLTRKQRRKNLQQQNKMYQQQQNTSSASGTQIRNVGTKFSAPVTTFEKAFNDFLMPCQIPLSPKDPVITLNGMFENLTPTNFKNFIQKKSNFLNSSVHWHMILIVHQNRVDRGEIIKSLYDVTKNELFAPFAYTSGDNLDFFIIYNQTKALKIFLDKGLVINVKGMQIPLGIKLGVALVAPGYPTLVSKIVAAITEQMNVSGGRDIDLSNFRDLMLAKGITYSLSSKGCLNLLFDQISGIEQLKTNFNVFQFANNRIRTLEPFTKLFGFVMESLDLRHNEISGISELNFLKHLEIRQIKLEGNFCTKLPKYREKILEICPTLTAIDVELNVVAAAETSINQQTIFGKGNKFRNGIGNDLISHIEDGTLIRKDPLRLFEFVQVKEVFHTYRNDYTWTQVTIHHDKSFTEDQLIDEIVENIFTNHGFFPSYYKRYNDHDTFYLIRNFEALNELMHFDLEHQITSTMKKIFFTLRMNAAKFHLGQVDWYYKINYVLSKRLIKNVLDISDFANNEVFSRLKVPMKSKFTINFILDHSKKQNSNIYKINAQKNGLKTLDGFQTLQTFSKLVTLDLRNNAISTLDGVSLTSSVTELMLDGNPICDKFPSPQAYVAEVFHYFPNLEWLDGHRVDSILDIATMQNFLVTRDAYTFGEEFVKTFFPIYDSYERGRLLEMYERKSILTVSCQYNVDLGKDQSELFQRLQKYKRFSRNVKIIANLKQACEKVFVGITNIGEVFEELPTTNHDLKSFCIDIPYYDPTKRVIISVSGIFESELGTNFLLGFTRNFILVPSRKGAFTITNEQLFIHDPPVGAKLQPIGLPMNNFESVKDLKPTEVEERKTKLILFQDLTELKKEECVRQLEESFWDFKVALATFNTMMDSNNIADNMFEFK